MISHHMPLNNKQQKQFIEVPKSSASDWLQSLSLLGHDCNKPQAYMEKENNPNSWSCGYFICGDWLLRTRISCQHCYHSNKPISKPLSMVHIDICVWASNNDVLHNVMQPIVRRITWQIGSDKRGVDHKSQVYIYSVLTFPYWHSLSCLSWPLLFAFNKDLTSRPVLDCAQMLYKIGYWFQFFKSCCISAELNRAWRCSQWIRMHAFICSFVQKRKKKKQKWFML